MRMRWPNAGSGRRTEVLDHLLIRGECHLWGVRREYVASYSPRRPHQGLNQRCPVPVMLAPTDGVVARHDTLGGLIHDYERCAELEAQVFSSYGALDHR